MLHLILLSLFLFSVSLVPRFEPAHKRADAQHLNELITNRDRAKNRVFYRVTYKELVEIERVNRERSPTQQVGHIHSSDEQYVVQKPPEIFFPNDQSHQKGQQKGKNPKVPAKKPSKDMNPSDQHQLAKLNENVTKILHEKLHHMN
jgi:hypothetical protein